MKNVVTERQKISCIRDVTEFAKDKGLTLSAVCKKVGVSDGYLSSVKNTNMSTRIYNDFYEFLESYEAEVSGDKDELNMLGELSMINTKLDFLVKQFEPKSYDKIEIPKDCLEIIEKASVKFDVEPEYIIRQALISHVIYNFDLYQKHGCMYEHCHPRGFRKEVSDLLD